jgi:betaine-aldehyde dehydrogenase
MNVNANTVADKNVNAIAASLAKFRPPEKLFIAGQWRDGRGPSLTSTNPADGSTNVVLQSANEHDVAEAVERGNEVMATKSWSRMLPHQRAKFLYRAADLLEARCERISAIQTADTGKTLGETTALVMSAAGTFRYFGAVLETREDALTPSRGEFFTMSVHEPLGVIATITPWNSPIASDAQKVAPALAGGNAVVLKPASWAPTIALELASVLQEAGFPEGLFSVLPGSGATAGEALINHRMIRKISFTGGTETGRRIGQVAAQRLIGASLELGGKSPTIVFDDADMDQALAGVLFGIFSSQGQSCIAGSRVFVHASIYDEFVERLTNATRALIVGSPLDPRTQVGPLVHLDHRSEVEQWVGVGVSEGASVLCGGERPTGPEHAQGSYYLPTILAGVGNQAQVCREEIFGPVAVVLPFTTDDDLITQANDSMFGLASGIWTRDYKRAWNIAHSLDCGTAWINTYKRFSIATPFGGTKDSGLGREKGIDGIRQYQSQKSLYWSLAEAPDPWARLEA